MLYYANLICMFWCNLAQCLFRVMLFFTVCKFNPVSSHWYHVGFLELVLGKVNLRFY